MPTQQETDIAHIHGDTLIRDFAFTDSIGVAIDLTGSSLLFSVKEKQTDVVYLINKLPLAITPDASGTAKLTVKPFTLAVGDYWYDVQWTDALLNVTTVLRWVLSVSYDITSA